MVHIKNSTLLAYTLCCIATLAVAGCGSLTGLPGHGGGKRFAIEQELVAAATRGAIKQLDLSNIKGKKVNLYINAIGDQGAGNIIGGRLSLSSELRGEYYQSPVTKERSVYPRYTATSTTNSSTSSTSNTATGSSDSSSTTTLSGIEDSSDSTSYSGTSSSTSAANSSSSSTSTTTTDTLLNSPEYTETEQQGLGGLAQFGLSYGGLGSYLSSDEISSDDLRFLSALIQTYLFLQGVHIAPPSEAEIDIYVTVDVFGTVRTRIEWFLANNEILKAKTSMEVMAVNHLSGEVVMPPQSVNAESEYNEQYILWAGPISIRKTLHDTEPLLSDYTQLDNVGQPIEDAVQNLQVPYPFSYEMEQRAKKKLEEAMEAEEPSPGNQ